MRPATTANNHALPAVIIAGLAILALAILLSSELAYSLGGALVGTVLALILHEAGHAVAVQMAGRRSYIIMTGFNIGVVHTLESSLVVHAAGPLLAGVVGLLVLMAAVGANLDALAVMSFPLILQLVCLTVLSRDGRLLVKSLVSTSERRV